MNAENYTEALEAFECFVRNVLDNDELTYKDKVELIKKQL